MTIGLEPAEIIDMAEAAEDPAATRASGPEGAFFRDGVFVIYDYGDHAYKVYLRAEKFSAAVKIEASMTEEELADLISHCRFFEIVE